MIQPGELVRLRLAVERAQKDYNEAVAAFDKLGSDSPNRESLRDAVRQAKAALDAAKLELAEALARNETAQGSSYEPPPKEQDQPTHPYQPDPMEAKPEGNRVIDFENAGRAAGQAAKDLYAKRGQFWQDVKSILTPSYDPE